MKKTTEQWKMIADNSKSTYWVSSNGRCKKLTKSTGDILITNGSRIKSSPNYLYFYHDYVHRLVAKAFLPNKRNLEQVDHINDNSFDNRACNLQWVTRKYNNSKDRSRKLKKQNAHFISHKGQMLKAQKDGEIMVFNTGYEAAESIGCSHVLVYKAASGQIASAVGWKLEWVDEEAN